jgi:hypothetical protein
MQVAVMSPLCVEERRAGSERTNRRIYEAQLVERASRKNRPGIIAGSSEIG